MSGWAANPDFNGNGQVDLDDFFMFSDAFKNPQDEANAPLISTAMALSILAIFLFSPIVLAVN